MKRFSVIVFALVTAFILFTEIIKSSKQDKTSPATIEVMKTDSTVNVHQTSLNKDMKDGMIPVVAAY